MTSYPLFITTPRGLEDVLAGEVGAMRLPVLGAGAGGVHTEGGLADIRRLNLWLRTAHRVLRQLGGAAPAGSPDDLYRAALRIPWEDALDPAVPFRVRASVAHPSRTDERFAALKVKDAIADRMRARCGRRPDSRRDPRAAAVFLHWGADGAATYFLDTSGEPLCRRGYRRESGEAPLRESLAAGLLLWSGWTGQAALVNPLCGRGTLAIEAAWIAANRAPGLLRSFFAFEALRGHEAEDWRNERARARAASRPIEELPPIVASDADEAAVDAARRNAGRAGVDRAIRLEVCPYDRTTLPDAPRWIVVNPPYGQRMGDEAELAVLYPGLGAWFRASGGPGRAVVISGHPQWARRIGLTMSRRATMFNGPLECRALEFELRPRIADRGQIADR